MTPHNNPSRPCSEPAGPSDPWTQLTPTLLLPHGLPPAHKQTMLLSQRQGSGLSDTFLRGINQFLTNFEL